MGGGLHPPQVTLDAWASDTDQYPRGRSQGLEIVILLGSLLAFALAVVAARLVARLKFRRNPAVDDVLISFAVLPMAGFDVSVILGWNRYGVGKHAWDISHAEAADARMMLWTATFCYILSSSLIKISIFLFYRRLSPSTFSVTLYWVIWASIGFVICYMTVYEVMLFVNCQPLDAFWKQMIPAYNSYRCLDEATAFFSEAAISVAQDFLACILPMFMLWGLKFSGRQHTALVIIFFVGLFVSACGVLRCVLIYYYYHKTYDTTWAQYNLWIWTAIELHMGMGCACLPSLRLFFTRLLSSSPPATEQSLPSRSLQTPAYDVSRGEGVAKAFPDDARSLEPFAPNRLHIPTPTFSDFDPGPPPPTPPSQTAQNTGYIRPRTLDPKVTGSFINLYDMDRPPRPMSPQSSKGSEISKSRATSRATTDPFTGNEITSTPTPALSDFDPGPPPPTPLPKSPSGKNTKSVATVASRPPGDTRSVASSKYEDESVYQTPKPASIISVASSRYESVYMDAGQPPPKPIPIITKTKAESTYTDPNIPTSGLSSKYNSVAGSSRSPEDGIYVDSRRPPPHPITVPGSESIYVDSRLVPDTPHTAESIRYDDDSLIEGLFGNDDMQQSQDMLEDDTDTPIAQALNEPEHVYDPTPRQTIFGTVPALRRTRASTVSEGLDSRQSAQLTPSMTFLDRGSLMERGGIPLFRERPKNSSSTKRRTRDVLSLMERGALTQSQVWDDDENTNDGPASGRHSRSWLFRHNPSFGRRSTNRQAPPRDSRTFSTVTMRERDQSVNDDARFSTVTFDSHDFTSVQRNTRFWNLRDSKAGDTASTFFPSRPSYVEGGGLSSHRFTRTFSSFRDRDSRISIARDSYYSFSGGNNSNTNLPSQSTESQPPLPLPIPALQRYGYGNLRRSSTHAGDYGRDRGSIASFDLDYELHRLSQDLAYNDALEALAEYENEDEGQVDDDKIAAASASAAAERQLRNQVLVHQRELYRQHMQMMRQPLSHQQRWDDNSVLEEEEEDEEEEDDSCTIRLSAPRKEDEDEDEDAATVTTTPSSADDDGTQTEVPDDESRPGNRESVMSQGESVLMYYAEEKDPNSEGEDDEFSDANDLYSGHGWGDYDERGSSTFYEQ